MSVATLIEGTTLSEWANNEIHVSVKTLTVDGCFITGQMDTLLQVLAQTISQYRECSPFRQHRRHIEVRPVLPPIIYGEALLINLNGCVAQPFHLQFLPAFILLQVNDPVHSHICVLLLFMSRM
jgi:hypothetical protein